MIFLGLLAIFMAGCSKVVEHVSLQGGEVRYEWMTDLSLPVPLMFDFETVSTKGTINDLDGLAEKDFAFFAVNKNADVLTAEKDINLPDNAKARSRKGADGRIYMDFVDASGAAVPYYYPAATEDNYSFYAYHSTALGTGTLPAEIKDKYITVDVPVAVSDDILWGAAIAPVYTDGNSGVQYDGFNARYIRKVGITPAISFEHPASCLSFQITKKGTSSLKFKSIDVSVMDIPTKATLCVADMDGDDQDMSGAFIKSDSRKDVPLDLDDTGAETPIFIVPQKEALTLNLDMSFSDGSSSALTYKIDPKQYGLDNGFEKGTRYTFNLIVHAAQQIKIEVSLESYKDAFDETMTYDPDDLVQIQ